MSDFEKVCHISDLVPDSGMAALVGNTQVALYYIDGEVYAVDNFDPLAKNFTMSRGMCGDLKGELMFAAPTHKEHYSLMTGQCLDQEGVSIPVYEAKIENDEVWVKL